MSRDRLIEELWAEDPPAAARHALEVHVSRLRKALGANGGSDPVLVTRAPGYLLHVAPGMLDLHRFEGLLAEGREALERGDPARAARALREGEGLWRGRPLADLEFEPFARVDVERLEELHLVAVEERIDAELALGAHRGLIAELEALVAEHPLRERLRVQLLLALYRCGRQADALDAYRRARSTLVEQIGVEPGPELHELHAAILRQDPALLAPGPVELPRELETTSPLFGRDAELGRLRAAWERARGGEGGVVVLSGPDGIGRLRLAAELAGELHREGMLVLYGAAGAERAHGVERPALLVLDEAGSIGLRELASELAAAPVLVVAIGSDLPLAAAERIALTPLDPVAIAAIAALYVPDGMCLPVAELAERSGGVPWHAHRLAAEWARAQAARRLSPVAQRAAAERGGLRRAEQELEATVADVQAVSERAERHTAGRAVTVCPFQGLATFDIDDARFFFGRERLVAEMAARLAGAPLLGVVGASGSGKSSAVRAGLVAGLAGGVLPGSERWARVLVRPGEHPLATLERATAEAEPHDRALLVVDQFEETFTVCRDEAERVAFADALVAAAGGDAAVVVAVRADFYGRCAAYPELARLLAANHVLVGPMRRDELRRAIELPTQRAGLRVEPELVERLLDDVDHEPGALPLLSTALLELWQQRKGRDLSTAGYEGTGGVRAAVARLAETAYGRLDPRAAGHRAAHPASPRRRGRRRRPGPPPGRARGARSRPRRGHRPRARRARRQPARHGQCRHGGGGARGAAARVAAAARLARGGRRGPAAAPAPRHRRARMARGRSRSGRALPRGSPGVHAGLGRRARGRPQRSRAGVRRREPRAEGRRGGARPAHEPAAADAGDRRARAAGARRRRRRACSSASATRHATRRAPPTRGTSARDALGEQDLDRALLLARQAVDLEDSVETRGNLLATLTRSPAAIGVSRVGHGRLNNMAMRPDGGALVVGDEHGTVTFLNPATGRRAATVRSTRRRRTSGSSCSTRAARGCSSAASACCGCSTPAASASWPSSRCRRRTSSSSTWRSLPTGARSSPCTR